jgi:hypothetical protein
MGLLRHILCRFGHHRQLDVIQTFGSAQRIGCPDCGRQFGIHHGMRSIVPWDSDLEQMYRDFGHDTAAPVARWQAYRKAKESA